MFRSPSPELHASVDYERRLTDTNTRNTGCSIRSPRENLLERECHETKWRVGKRSCSRFPVGSAASAFLHLSIIVARRATATVCR